MPDLRAIARAAAPAAMPLAYLAFALLVYWNEWTPIEGAARTFRDPAALAHWGDLVLQERALASGELALWNPFDRAGFPIAGDPRTQLLYPLSWGLAALGALAGGVGYALVAAEAVLHAVLGAVGMHLLLRRRDVPEPGCYAGGALFASSCPAFCAGGSALTWGFMWLPWILLALDALAARPRLRRGALLGTAAAMPALAGAPAALPLVALVAIPYGIAALWGRIRAALPALALAAGAASLWVLPLALSLLELRAHAGGGALLAGPGAGSSFPPIQLVGALAPGFGGGAAYYGLLPLAAFGALVLAGRDRRGTALAAAGAVALIAALGARAAGLGATLFLYPVSGAMAAGAGLGFGVLLTLRDGERRRAIGRRLGRATLAVAFAIAIAAAIAAAIGDAGEPYRGGLAWGLAAAIVAAALVRGMASAEGRRRAVYGWAAAAFLALDLWGASAQSRWPQLGPKPALRFDDLAGELAGVEAGRYRIYDRGRIGHRPGARLGVRDFGGYEDDPRALSRYADYRMHALRHPILLGHANVRYLLRADARPRAYVDDELMTRTSRGVYELAKVAPVAFYVARPQRVAGAEEARRALEDLVPGREAVVEADVPPGPEGAPAVAGRVLHRAPNRLVVDITTPGPGLVVVSEAYYPGWSATVGDEPAEVVPANGMFRGVPVDGAGRHRIDMRFVPHRFWAGLPAYAAAVLLAAWALVSGGRRGARRR